MVSGVSIGSQISDHYVVNCDISLRKPKPVPNTISFRKIKQIKIEAFKKDILDSDLYRAHNSLDLQSVVELYESSLSQILDKHAPVITKTIRDQGRGPWYDNAVREARKRRAQLSVAIANIFL